MKNKEVVLDNTVYDGQPSMVDILPQVEHRLDEARALDLKLNGLAVKQFDAAKLLGQIESFTVTENYSKTAKTILIHQAHESKAYKGLKVPTSQGVKTLNSFEDFCELLGISQRKALEDIQNLKTFGQEFMEAAEKMGLGYRDMRKLRALPEKDRITVLDGRENTTDPEVLKDLIEELASKNHSEKTKSKELKESLEAKEKLVAQKNKALDEVKEELIKLKNIPPSEAIKIQAEKEQIALEKLHKEGLKILGEMEVFLAAARGVLELENISLGTAQIITHLFSGLFSKIADDVLAAGIDVDFRIAFYPLELGEIAQRGMGLDMESTEN